MLLLKQYQFEVILLTRLLLSCLCGMLIGYERENRSKFAGIRTHIIVALGSCLAVIVSKYGFLDTQHYDTSRIAAQVISGIGFLGTGVIFVKEDTISGLTTAAGIWTTSIIGMSFAVGLYIFALIATVLVLVVQIIFCKTDLSYIEKKHIIFVRMDNIGSWSDIERYIRRERMKYELIYRKYYGNSLELELEYYFKDDEEFNDFILYLSTFSSIKEFEIKHIQ